MDAIRYETEGPVAIVTINRPQARNAVDGPTAAELAAAFRRFADDDALAAAVLTGADGTFCAGADLKAVAIGRGNAVRLDGDGPMGPTRMLLEKPVIAAVEGFAVAGGLELAAWCDLRVAARDAVFGVYCRRWGVPLIDGGTIRLSRLLGHSHALDLILTGRGVSGEEALRMGLANRLVEPGTARREAVQLADPARRLPAALPARRPPVLVSAVGALARRCAARRDRRRDRGARRGARRRGAFRERERATRQGRVETPRTQMATDGHEAPPPPAPRNSPDPSRQ